MDEWFDFTDLELENTNEYIEKIQLEETDDTEVIVGVQSKQKRENSWIRKYKILLAKSLSDSSSFRR